MENEKWKMENMGNMEMRRVLIRYAWLPLLATGFTACDRDEAKSVDFGVSIANTTIYAGDAVNFEFEGNPDYIVFYPGTKECSYANRERTRIELDSIGVSCRVEQVYTDLESYSGEEHTIMHAFISQDYSGELTPEAIRAATWKDISGYGDNQLNMPVVIKSPNATVDYTAIDLSAYLDSKFFIAFRYAAGPNNNEASRYGKPRVQIKELTMAKREPDKNIIRMTDAVSDWGFNTIRVKVAKENNTKYDIEKNQLSFFPDAASEKKRDVEVWMVSQKLDPAIVLPDRGMPIKSTNARLPSYQFHYDKPGTYTATFIATNANMWNSRQTLREVTVTVQEKPAGEQPAEN